MMMKKTIEMGKGISGSLFLHLVRLFDSFAMQFHPTEMCRYHCKQQIGLFMSQRYGSAASRDSRHRDDMNIFLLTRNFTARVYSQKAQFVSR